MSNDVWEKLVDPFLLYFLEAEPNCSAGWMAAQTFPAPLL